MKYALINKDREIKIFAALVTLGQWFSTFFMQKPILQPNLS